MSESSIPALLRRSVRSSIVVFILVAALFAITTRGHLRRSFDSVTYLSLADAAQQGKVSTFTTSTQANFTIVLFPALIAFIRKAAPLHWEAILLAINTICAAVTAVFLMKLVRAVTDSTAAAVAALLFYVCAHDIFVWIGWLLTDHIYTMLSVIVFALLVRGIANSKTDNLSRSLKMYAALALAVITRPVGFVLLPLTVVMQWVFVKRDTKVNRRAVWILFVSGFIAAIVVHAYFFQDMRRWPSDFMRPKLQEYADREQSGEVVWGHTETFHAPPVSFGDHVSIEADRFVRFFQVTSERNSRGHNLYSILYYLLLYALALFGIATALRGDDRRRSAVVHVTLLWILTAAALSAVSILDYDWRYRLPLMPQMILLAAIGTEAAVRGFAPVATPETAV
jgi:4-amino-4-deoxy-L-arabinose transferase-like glycosyltransferase